MTSTKNKTMIHQQMASLDSTDPNMTVWNDHVLSQITNETSLKQQQLLWGGNGNGKGGRGRGGRGMSSSRNTIQPNDIIIPDLTLEYVSDETSGCVGSKVLLKDAKLKLLSGCIQGDDGDGDDGGGSSSSNNRNSNRRRVYALVGRNGCGKSTLLKRMHAKKIPGFINLNLKSMYIPQEVFDYDEDDIDGNKSPIDVVLGYRMKNQSESKEVSQKRIEVLEEELEIIMEAGTISDGGGGEIDDDEMERVCNEISLLEDQLNGNDNDDGNDNGDDNGDDNDGNDEYNYKASQVLSYFGIDEVKQRTAMRKLSGGQKKKVLLACTLFCDIDVLLLDEPTNHLDMKGIIQLRGLIQTVTHRQPTVLVLVSHDVDLINDVATDIIHMSNQTLTYYKGNYNDYILQKNEKNIHQLRKATTLEKQRNSMIKTIDTMHKQSQQSSSSSSSVHSKGGGGHHHSNSKISKQVNNRKKKLEKHGIDKDENGHRWTSQKAMTGIKVGSINSLDASTRKGGGGGRSGKKNYSELLKNAQLNIAPIPEKEVQFKFRNTTCQWHEPLISALDVGHGFTEEEEDEVNDNDNDNHNDNHNHHDTSNNDKGKDKDVKIKNMLFDSVDLCVDEKSITCILGENQSGKTTLLKILSDQLQPIEGKVQLAHNATIAYFDQHKADNLIIDGMTKYGSTISSISLLMSIYPKKTEQEIRTELICFGLVSQQASTYIQFLSGGERCRLCLAMLMISDPHVLILDEPSNHLDPESVNALAYGIKNWNGTVLLVSHDVHLIRQLGARCFILMTEGKLRYVQNGIDSYLQSLSTQESQKL